MSQDNYSILLEKLDEFIRKYYKNQLIKGTIYTLAILIISFITFTSLEYFGHFGNGLRMLLFYSFMLLSLGVLIKLILIPTFKLYKLGENISHEQAAEIIGKHFTNVSDKLFNVLQLNNLSSESTQSKALIEAGINQKITELKPIPFTNAIDFSANKRFLKYLIIPVVIFAAVGIINPAVFTDGTQRLVAHSSDFTPMAPFEFEIINDNLKGIKNEDFQLSIKIKGEVLPEKAFIQLGGNSFLLNKIDKSTFSYTLKNLQEDIDFKLSADGFDSRNYTLTAQPKPMLVNFDVSIDYPSYTQLNDEVVHDIGDLTIPQGSVLKWKFTTTASESLFFGFQDTALTVQQNNIDEYVVSTTAKFSSNYQIATANQFISNNDTLNYALTVIPDVYPTITVEQKADSTSLKRIYFKGSIKDDYGFKKLTFNYRVADSNRLVSTIIPINTNTTQNQYFYVWDFEDLPLKAGDEIDYYFEIFDNDGVHGSKSSRTQKMQFKVPTKEELEKKSDERSKEIVSDLEKSLLDAKKLKKDIDELNKSLIDKEKLGWQEKKKLEEIIDAQKKLREKIEKSKNENKQNNKEQKEFNELDQDILEKQEKLEELFEQLMTPEMKELYKELEKLMEEMNKDKLKDQLDKIELSNEELEKELDRSLEIFKQLEFEQKLNETIEKLEEIQKKQEELAKKSEDKNADPEALKKEQEKLNEEFDKLKEKLDELEKKNEELENPNEMPETEKEEEAAKEEMEKSAEDLGKKDKKNASDSQKKAAEEMQKMKEKLGGLQMEMQSAGSEEDMEDIRALLENLIQLSFDQEALIDVVKKANRTDPKFVDYSQAQKKLIDDSKTIEDSLFALSKRVMQLEATVNKEVTAIKSNMQKALGFLGDRNSAYAASNQQFAMTSINNLALILDEALQNMQKQMQAGQGSCSKPGGKNPKPSAAQMKKMQQQLNEQMQKMKDAMENGKSPGDKPGSKPGSKPGDKPGQGQGGMSKELAQMAAKQAAIRRELQKMSEELGKNGENGAGGDLKKLSDLMEQNETDIVNKNITRQTMMRQEEILTRLLESEKAEREREKDNKRESKEGRENQLRNPNEFFEYNKQKEKEVELLKTLPPSYLPFYKNKTNLYFENIK